nr:hypothetical protein CFP56_22179 [Quercus suber]
MPSSVQEARSLKPSIEILSRAVLRSEVLEPALRHATHGHLGRILVATETFHGDIDEYPVGPRLNGMCGLISKALAR